MRAAGPFVRVHRGRGCHAVGGLLQSSRRPDEYRHRPHFRPHAGADAIQQKTLQCGLKSGSAADDRTALGIEVLEDDIDRLVREVKDTKALPLA